MPEFLLHILSACDVGQHFQCLLTLAEKLLSSFSIFNVPVQANNCSGFACDWICSDRKPAKLTIEATHAHFRFEGDRCFQAFEQLRQILRVNRHLPAVATGVL